MRFDLPMGYDEECLEPACELFLQLFLQNAQIAIEDNIDDDAENEIPFQEDVDEGQEMEDYFSQENEEEEEDENDDDDGSQENDGNDSQNDDYDVDDSEEHESSITTITLSSDSEFSSETVCDLHLDDYEQAKQASSSSSSNNFSSETVFDSHQCADDQLDHASSSNKNEKSTDVELQDVEFHNNFEQDPKHDFSDYSEASWLYEDSLLNDEDSLLNDDSDAFHCSEVSSENSNNASCDTVNKENNLATVPSSEKTQPEHVLSSSFNNSIEIRDTEHKDDKKCHRHFRRHGKKINNDKHCDPNQVLDLSDSEVSWSSDTSYHDSWLSDDSNIFHYFEESSDNSNLACSNAAKKENDLATIPSNDLPPLSKIPQPECFGAETATSSNASLTSTYVSLFVVVSPTSFPSQSDNGILSGSSPDEKNSVIPISLSSPSTVLTDTEIIHSDDVPPQHSCKILNNFDESTSNIPDINDESYKKNDKKYLSFSEIHSASGIISKSEVNAGFHGVHPEFSMSENNLFQEMDMTDESNASNEVMSAVTVPSLKRKVCSPVEDNIVNKVPKFSSSDNSDSLPQESLGNSEKSTFNEENLVPSSVTEENIIFSLGNSIKERSINEQQKK